MEDIDAFHSVLAPVWHARPGPERLQSHDFSEHTSASVQNSRSMKWKIGIATSG